MQPTVDLTAEDAVQRRGAPVPGLVVVFAAGQPTLRAVPLHAGRVAVGREWDGPEDGSVSRHHADVAFDGRRWTVRDRGSRNGTYLDGARVEPERVSASAGVLRTGGMLALLVDDVAPFEGGVSIDDGVVLGPAMRRVWRELEVAAGAGSTVHVQGESGVGKELAAAHFNACGPRAGPLVAMNCAAIPEGLAERMLFGAVRGAYSGADRDAEGCIAASDGGTLFLDEVAELDPRVQPKLLRVLETGEVQPLGAVRATKVRLRVCSATHGELREAVAAGRFRQDLYYRIGRPIVRVPVLRDRREEVPWLAHGVARAEGIDLKAGLVEQCMLRPWPGNVRELRGEVRQAAHRARADGRTSARAGDLDDAAGLPMAAPAQASDDAAIEAALASAHGNVSAAARALGLHRNQLRRWIARNGVDPRDFAGGAS